MNELALFAGAGGGILGGHLLGWRTVCAVESGQYAVDVLVARQNDGLLPPFPIWDDVRTFDGRPWRGRVDVVSGGFPCQDISLAGNGAGIDGPRSGLWQHMARIIGDVRPRFAFVENSPALAARGLGRVLGDLHECGYDAEWCVLGAAEVGAPHLRKRIWILAHANSKRSDTRPGDARAAGRDQPGHCRDVADADRKRLARDRSPEYSGIEGPRRNQSNDCGARPGRDPCPAVRYWPTEPDVGRVAHGVAARVDRLRALGNGQVPRVAAAAFELLRRRGGW
jgi:DNA (cytosine-5)-methyltransferase 1